MRNMDIYEWIIKFLMGYLRTNEAGALFILSLSSFVLLLIVSLLINNHLFKDGRKIASLPELKTSSNELLSRLLSHHSDPKIRKKPLYKQIWTIQKEQRTKFPARIIIPISRMLFSNLPPEIGDENLCHICKRKIRNEEPYGYYRCCFGISHYNHVLGWNNKSNSCPFCRQETSFLKIIR